MATPVKGAGETNTLQPLLQRGLGKRKPDLNASRFEPHLKPLMAAHLSTIKIASSF